MTIVRTASKVTGGITAAEKVALDAHAAKWIANAMSTEPADRPRLADAIRALYRAANLKEPRVVIVDGPQVMAFAGGFAAAIWWLRKNGQATYSATLSATDLATALATDLATDSATDSATDLATDSATASATLSATASATYSATLSATDLATDLATLSATASATYSATLSATDSLHWAARLADDFVREFGGSRDFFLGCARNWANMYQGGNMWSAWDCYLTAFRDVLGLRLKEHERYAAWEACSLNGGFRVMHEEFCIVCDRPEILKVDAQNRPHCDDGPSHRWRDGWSLYYVHGVAVPQWLIENPEELTAEKIEAETNAEVRRVMIDRYGPARFVKDSGAKIVHQLPPDFDMVGLRDARLLRKDVPDDEPIIYIDLLNSTPEPDGHSKRYMLRVDPNAYGGEASRDCLAAVASTWRNADGSLTFKKPSDYRPSFES